MFGVECEDGWKGLYQPVIDYINKYNEEHRGTDSFITILQIKEKYGGLRFYWNAENIPQEICAELTNMIHEAETESYKVCEFCGTRDKVGITVDGWYTTICEDCVLDYNKKDGLFRLWKYDGKVYLINKDSKHEQSD